MYLCGFSDPHFRFFLGSRTTFILTGVMNIKYLLILPMINFYQRIDPSLLIEFQRHLSRNKKLKKYNTKCGSHCLIEDWSLKDADVYYEPASLGWQVDRSWNSQLRTNCYFQKPKLGCRCRFGIDANLFHWKWHSGGEWSFHMLVQELLPGFLLGKSHYSAMPNNHQTNKKWKKKEVKNKNQK